MRVFIFQKYGKFVSVSLGHFIKHKPLIFEECQSDNMRFYLFFAIQPLFLYFILTWLIPKRWAVWVHVKSVLLCTNSHSQLYRHGTHWVVINTQNFPQQFLGLEESVWKKIILAMSPKSNHLIITIVKDLFGFNASGQEEICSRELESILYYINKRWLA